MQTSTIQRQYDEVIAHHYDRDPHRVIARSLDRALEQLMWPGRLAHHDDLLRVLDLGVGTGAFLNRLREQVGRIRPYGIDISEKMIDIARNRLPDLEAEVDDAAHLDRHFVGEQFDVVCTHFVTGFVPARVLAPMIHGRLAPGGFWSIVGGTKEGFPILRQKAQGRLTRCLLGGRTPNVQEMVVYPADRRELTSVLIDHDMAIVAAETFHPAVLFKNFADFMNFAYYGGWLTPFIESLGLHQANAVLRTTLNTFFFPVRDHHSIEIVLAQKNGR